MKSDSIARMVGILLIAVVIVALGLTAWIVDPQGPLNTTYGVRYGRAASSVNGTSVLAEMFDQAGAKIQTGRRLSPKLARSQTIVWAPNSFELPSAQELDFFEENWLNLDDYEDRTLVYIARDYDAAIEYWREQATQGDDEDFIENTRRKARAQAEHAYMRSLTGIATKCRWFSIDNQQHFFETRPTGGSWLRRIKKGAGEDIDYVVSGILEPPPGDTDDEYGLQHKVLLRSKDTPLVMEIRDEYNWPSAKVIVVLNGSSLLNYPLVKHQNRLLASEIIDACELPERVTFLESGPNGLRVSTAESGLSNGFGPLTVWPINAILLHLIAVGILFCVMVFPIFGRPKEAGTDTPNDFGKHVDAVRRLLEISQNREAAIAKVNQYRQLESDNATATPSSKPVSGNPFKVSEA